MTPLRITASVPQLICVPHGRLPLDSLLMAQRALELGMPPVFDPEHAEPIEIPVQREAGGRFHLCSDAVVELVEKEHPVRHIHKRAPLEQYVQHGVRGSVELTAKEDKGYRIPLELGFVRGGQLEWWCLGDATALRELLSGILFLGKKRSNAFGEVRAWTIERCHEWPGFPVVRDGKPLRRLPADWPGLTSPRTQFAVMTPPYWHHVRAELCAVP